MCKARGHFAHACSSARCPGSFWLLFAWFLILQPGGPLRGDRSDSFSPHPENADEKAGEDRLKSQGDKRCARYNDSHRAGIVQVTKAGQPPLPDCGQQQTATGQHRHCCDDQPFFQIHDFEKALQVPVGWKESFGNRERLGEDGEENPLVAAQDGEAREQQRVSIEGAVPEPQTRHCHEITK